MTCPTCGHSMSAVYHTAYADVQWCNVCGTKQTTIPGGIEPEIQVPELVVRCRIVHSQATSIRPMLDSIGVTEAIYPPEGRS